MLSDPGLPSSRPRRRGRTRITMTREASTLLAIVALLAVWAMLAMRG